MLLLVGCQAQAPASSSDATSAGTATGELETSVGSEGTGTGASTESGTDTGTTGDTSDDGGGCADAGNELPEDQQPIIEPGRAPTLLPTPSDLGSNPNECDVYAQDCPVEQKCVPYASTGGSLDASKCVAITGSGMIGDPCTSTGVIDANDDCGADSACWLLDDQNMGVCTGFCGGSVQDPVCAEGQTCFAQGFAVAYCMDGCNPLTQACPAGQACMWTGVGFGCMLTAAKFPAGEVCGDFDDCGIGMICVDAAVLPNCGGASCCAEFCDLDCTDLCSQVGTHCEAFYAPGEAPAGDADVGVCIAG